MRISKIAVFLASFVVVVAALLLFLSRRSNPIEWQLGDGSIVRLERVVYGKRDKFMPQGGWLRRLEEAAAAHLPSSWTSRFNFASRNRGSWWNNTVVHTNSDALQVW